MKPTPHLTRSQANALDRIVRLGVLNYSGIATQLAVSPRLWPLLAGPTGAGKSFLVRSAAEQLGASYLRVAYGDWIVQGARQPSTMSAVISAALTCPRLVIHLDELDKMPIGRGGEWAQAVMNDIWALLDGQLPVEKFAAEADGKTPLSDREKRVLEANEIMDAVFIVGSGTWQSLFDGVERQQMGFAAIPQRRSADAGRLVLSTLEAVRGPSSELLARFDGTLLFVAPPTLDEAVAIVERLGALQFAQRHQFDVQGELQRLLPRQGFRAIESVLTELLLRGWWPVAARGSDVDHAKE